MSVRPAKKGWSATATDDAQVFYDRTAQALLGTKAVTEKKMFGTTALFFKGKVFLFPWKGNLVLKLPEEQVSELLASRDGELFDPGHGRTSKTWIALFPSVKRRWPKLVRAARKFVEG